MLALFTTVLIDPGQWPWQIPLLLTWVAGYFVGGMFLLQWVIRRIKPALTVKSVPKGRCLLTMFLAGLAAMALLGTVTMLFRAAGTAMGTSLTLIGLLVGLLPATAAFIMVIFAMFDLSIRQAALASIAPLVGSVLLAGAVAAACHLPVRADVIESRQLAQCRERLMAIDGAIRTCERAGRQPGKLQEFVDPNMLKSRDICCPGNSGRQAGFIYRYRASELRGRLTNQIRACDFLDNHGGKGRNVLFTNGTATWFSEANFQNLLHLDENRNFAQALAEAESQK